MFGEYKKWGIKIPKGFMNYGITTGNYFIADTNDSNNWDTIKIPLPDKELNKVWSIKSDNNGKIKFILIDNHFGGPCTGCSTYCHRGMIFPGDLCSDCYRK